MDESHDRKWSTRALNTELPPNEPPPSVFTLSPGIYLLQGWIKRTDDGDKLRWTITKIGDSKDVEIHLSQD